MEANNIDIQTETNFVGKKYNQVNRNFRGRGGNFKKVKKCLNEIKL
jgi:hypothetical protein